MNACIKVNMPFINYLTSDYRQRENKRKDVNLSEKVDVVLRLQKSGRLLPDVVGKRDLTVAAGDLLAGDGVREQLKRPARQGTVRDGVVVGDVLERAGVRVRRRLAVVSGGQQKAVGDRAVLLRERTDDHRRQAAIGFIVSAVGVRLVIFLHQLVAGVRNVAPAATGLVRLAAVEHGEPAAEKSGRLFLATDFTNEIERQLFF